MSNILFSTIMVKALLSGRKTQTRRLVKGKALAWLDEGGFTPEFVANPDNNLCPYGKPGDAIYVKETHYRRGTWVKDGITKTGKQKWKFKPSDKVVLFENTKPALFEKSRNKDYPDKEMWYKRSSLFLPVSLCRMMLIITDIRIERLNQINTDDAISEGVLTVPVEFFKDIFTEYFEAYKKWENTKTNDKPPLGHSPVEQFNALWQIINGAESLQSNPWVWVISFTLKMVTNEQN
jgi:hypothetical protein